MAFSGTSTMWVQRQFGAQSAGLLSPLQNWSGEMSFSCDIGGAGGDTYEISSIKDIRWSPEPTTGIQRENCQLFICEINFEMWKLPIKLL